MLVKTKAIVISTLKYNEKSLIVKCLTRVNGIQTYFIHNAFTGKNNKQKKVFFQPLNQIEIEAYHNNKNNLQRIKEVKIYYPYHSIYLDIIKSSIVLFLSEILHNIIKEEGKDEQLFDYLESALQWFDTQEEMFNFHLVLLLQLTKYLGFYPQENLSDKKYFNISEGVFSETQSLNSLTIEESELLKRLLRLKFEDNQKVFSVIQRQQLLKIVLDYYKYNIERFKTPSSLQVLKEVFN
ncbi:DNA repair protein RecO [Flavobacterium jejuense]|uniref:DNA repair protein RecO n=1 Tax=Flavobacterium jejuense TaxID=1544455 RepID=A0ABX0IRK4_9FLAO|nr:DNA repair protein RecO [Flavobacterium jejuense]NHN25414.1 DNA repair protein RecO [Flavobacterium jejuense]